MALWTYLIPPVAGIFVGYFTNDIAIKMLFRPYRTYTVLGQRVPFTPGLIPQNQPRLARQVSNTIMGSLLTPEELRNLARRLLETERVRSAIQWLLQAALSRLDSEEHQQQAAEVTGRILADLFGESLPRLIRALARQEHFLDTQINQLFDQVLLDIKLTREQSTQLSTWILEQVLPPPNLRESLIDFLTDRNIDAIDREFRERATGSYWVVANIIGARTALVRLRSYCLEEPETAESVLAQLLSEVGASRRLTEIIENLSLQNLPIPALRQLRKGLREGIQDYLRTQGPEVLEELSQSIEWEKVAGLVLGRLKNSKAMQLSIEQISLDLALILERYLDRDMESLMAQVLPILNLDQVITDRVNATEPAQLEDAIQTIVRQELQAIVNLGGILGFVVGCFQVLFFWATGQLSLG